MIFETVLAVIGAEVGFAAIGFGVWKAFYKKSKNIYSVETQSPFDVVADLIDTQMATTNTLTSTDDSSDGIIVVEQPETEVIMTVEEHLNILKKKYPDAWKDYNAERSIKRPIHERASSRVMRSILAVEAGTMTAMSTQYVLQFGNGDEIWIANKYFAFGNIHLCRDDSSLETSSDSFRLDPYVWLRIVDLEIKLTHDDSWKMKTVRVKV